MFKSKKVKAGFGEEPSTPKFHSVLLPEIREGENYSPVRPTTPWFAALVPSTPRPTTPRPNIVRAATPQPNVPLKPCLKMSRRTMTTTGDNLEARQEVSKLREEYVPPAKVSPTTRERKLSMTGGGASMTKPKKVTTPHSYTIGMLMPGEGATPYLMCIFNSTDEASTLAASQSSLAIAAVYEKYRKISASF